MQNSENLTNENTLSKPLKRLSTVLIMVCIYMFLVIERPWESIRYLEGIKIEFPYALLLIAAAVLHGRFYIKGVRTDKWVFALFGLHFLLAPFAYIPKEAIDTGIDYGKLVVLYILMLSVCDDELDLQALAKAFVISMMIYVLHSFWQYTNGRHVYRMGIVRMIGADYTNNDPNTFGASVVLSFPITWAVMRHEVNKWMKRACIAYLFLGVTCIILTGSRSSLVTLLFLCILYVLSQKSKRRFQLGIILIISTLSLWSVMPENKKERMRTLWDENAGPKNAHESAEGRTKGYKAGLAMFKEHPLTGIGTGRENFLRYRVDKVDGMREQAHNLAGEVLGEMGIFGVITFLGLIVCTIRQFRKAQSKATPGTFLHMFAGAGFLTVLLLIFFGIGGHNFYRPLWLWLAAFSSLAVAFSAEAQRPEI